MKKPDNKRAQIMGVLNHGTFPGIPDATRAALEFGVDAHDSGHDLSTLAVVMSTFDASAVRVTLARRHYWRNVAPESLAADVRARLMAQEPKHNLLVLVAHDDCDSHFVLTLSEMQEAL
jgi:hypothetical protein